MSQVGNYLTSGMKQTTYLMPKKGLEQLAQWEDGVVSSPVFTIHIALYEFSTVQLALDILDSQVLKDFINEFD